MVMMSWRIRSGRFGVGRPQRRLLHGTHVPLLKIRHSREIEIIGAGALRPSAVRLGRCHGLIQRNAVRWTRGTIVARSRVTQMSGTRQATEVRRVHQYLVVVSGVVLRHRVVRARRRLFM